MPYFVSRLLAGAGALLLVAVSAVGPGATATPRVRTAQSGDALWQRTSAQLSQFTRWLAEGGQTGHGYVGEVGWPGNDTRWTELATSWYRQADRSWLWVSAWSAGEWWPAIYPLAVYAADGTRLVGPNPQALVVEAQAYRKRSVNFSGAEFGTPQPTQTMSTTFSSRRPGVVGRDYRWPDPSSLTFLAGRGITTIRLPLRWERVQPTVGAPLDPAEVGRLVATIDAAAATGIEVIVDVHNYGAYWAGDLYGTGWRKPLSLTGWLRVDHLADLWFRLSEVLAGRPGVVGYDLMNEPIAISGGASTWERASQLAVSAVRSRGDTTRIMVEGYGWSGPASFAKQHPNGPWVVDPLDRVFYEAHHYFDCDGSGKYTGTYDDAVACAS